jgi:hypothetical protein
MGGEISVSSTLGTGTTFTATVPFTEALSQEEQQHNKVLDAVSMRRLSSMKVLLVEDNEFNRMVAEDTLKESIPGIRLDVAVNGQEAVDSARKTLYDVILMDIQMPVMDGLTATIVIRNQLPEPYRHTKIIAMTANVLQEDVNQYFAAGMNAFISKPFHEDELLLKMDSVMGNTPTFVNNKPNTENNVKEEAPPNLPDKVTDMQFLKQLTNGNEEKMKKYINMFLDNAPKLLDNIDKALAIKDYPTIKIAAHSLKPQLSYMGVKEEVSKIFMIEQSAGEAAHFGTLPILIRNLNLLCNKAFIELKNN